MIVFAAVKVVLAGLLLGSLGSDVPTHRTPPPPTYSPLCAATAPTTAAGYQAMFDSLPSALWGAADVSISVRMTDGRHVWLYGDTVTQAGTAALDTTRPWRMVHSSAIVQRGGCLYVANDGAQLLPDDTPGYVWYWIHDAKALPNDRIAIHARRVAKTGDCAWCFEDGGLWATAIFQLTPAGDLRPVLPWPNLVDGPAPPPGPFYPAQPDVAHHYGYSRSVHTDIRLADGQYLVSTCQNDDDGLQHPWSWFRPYFLG